MGFFYSFTETILHSLWQAGLCMAIYAGCRPILKQTHPLQKRNLLFLLLAAQVTASFTTFMIYFTGSGLPHSLYNNSAFGGVYQHVISAYGRIIFYAYIIAIAAHSFWLSRRWNRLKNYYHSGLTKPSADLKVFTRLTAYQLGIKRKVTIWYSTHVDTPLTFGMLKPIILLPLSLLNHLSIRETEAIILHELAHIRSRDYLLNRLLLIAETLYFFNPFIRTITKEIRLEREKNCDAQVLDFEYPELVYAEALLKTARHSHAARTFHLGAVTGKAELLKRIEFFTAGSVPAMNKRAGFLFLLPLIMFVAAALFFLPGFNKNKTEDSTLYPIAAYGVLNAEIMPAVHSAAMNEFMPPVAITALSAAPHANVGCSVENEEVNGETSIPAVAVAYDETPDSVQEFIYEVETPKGVMTQSFKLTLVKGQWIMQPQWMVLETAADSLVAGRCPADTVFHAELPQ